MILRAADQDGREVSGRGWETSTSRALAWETGFVNHARCVCTSTASATGSGAVIAHYYRLV